MTDVTTDPAAEALAERTVDVLKRVDGQLVVETEFTESAEAAEALAEALDADPSVLGASVSELYQPTSIDYPTDPNFALAEQLPEINATGAWSESTGASTIVAVLDTAVDVNHPDIKGRVFDPVNVSSGPEAHYHGTMVAGIIAGGLDNGTGATGVAPDATIMPFRVCSDTGCATSAVATGIIMAAERGADVINLSLAGLGYTEVTAQAVRYARSLGSVVVASAGNSGEPCAGGSVTGNCGNAVLYPAAYNGVVSVAAAGALASPWSQHNMQVDISAPGEAVYAAYPGAQYTWGAGTSFSGPQVAAAAALMVSVNPGLTPDAVQAGLMATASNRGHDSRYGAGVLDVGRAVRNATLPELSGLSVTTTATSASATWDAVAGATGYQVLVNGRVAANAASTSSTLTGLTPGDHFALSVVALTDSGTKEFRPVLVIPAPAPLNAPVLRNVQFSGSSIVATVERVPNAAYYVLVHNGVIAGQYSNTGSYATFNASIADAGTARQSVAFYAVDAQGQASALSETKVLGTGELPMSAPENLRTAAKGRSVMVSWNPVTNAKRYDVLIDGAKVASTYANIFMVRAMTPGKHEVRIRPVTVDGVTGPESGPVSVTVPDTLAPRYRHLDEGEKAVAADPALATLLGARGTTSDTNRATFSRKYANGVVSWSGVDATSVRVVAGADHAFWIRNGGATGSLGAVRTSTRTTDFGTTTEFVNATVFTSAAGTFLVNGSLRGAFSRAGGLDTLGPATGVAQKVGSTLVQEFGRAVVFVSSVGKETVLSGASLAVYQRLGGVAALGVPTRDPYSVNDVRIENFERAQLHTSAAGTIGVTAPFLDALNAVGGTWELGTATSEPSGTDVVRQSFTKGLLMSSERGTFALLGPIRDAYESGAHPELGAPTGNQEPAGTGRIAQHFTKGSLYLENGVVTWGPVTAEDPALGRPTGPKVSFDGGTLEPFENGSIITSSEGRFALIGEVDRVHARLGGVAGLGVPTSEALVIDTGEARVQLFSKGRIYTSPKGTFGVTGTFINAYDQLGGPAALGLPLGNAAGDSGGSTQAFERATLMSSPKGTFPVSGALLSAHKSLGGTTKVGWPTGMSASFDGGVRQVFTNGDLYNSATGTFNVAGALRAEYNRIGGPARYGVPFGNAVGVSGGSTQAFGGGTLMSSAKGTFAVNGVFLTAHKNLGGTAKIGWPLGASSAVSGGARQAFTGGDVYSSKRGTYGVTGAFLTTYNKLGGSAKIGVPVKGGYAIKDGTAQDFAGGNLYNSKSGMYLLKGTTLASYLKAGGANSYLGVPSRSEFKVNGGLQQNFTGGRVLTTHATSKTPAKSFAMGNVIAKRYDALKGSAGALGMPNSDQVNVKGGWRVTFTNHALYSDTKTAVVITGAFATRYNQAGAADSCLGLPTREAYSVTGGTRMDFQKGTITYNNAKRSFAVACRK